MSGLVENPCYISLAKAQFYSDFQLPGIGLFELPSMPDTSLEGTGKDEYAADGLKIEVVEPMKKWRIRYDGKLRCVRILVR